MSLITQNSALSISLCGVFNNKFSQKLFSVPLNALSGVLKNDTHSLELISYSVCLSPILVFSLPQFKEAAARLEAVQQQTAAVHKHQSHEDDVGRGTLSLEELR